MRFIQDGVREVGHVKACTSEVSNMMDSYSYRPMESHYQALALTLTRAALETQNMDVAAVVDFYKRIEDRFLPLAAGDEVLALETRRRVAEGVLSSATRDPQAHALCQRLFENLVDLGFTNLERKGTFYLIYSKHCMESGQIEEGTRLMEELEAELSRLLSKEYASNHPEGAAWTPVEAGRWQRLASLGPHRGDTSEQRPLPEKLERALAQSVTRVVAAECNDLIETEKKIEDELLAGVGGEDSGLRVSRALTSAALYAAMERRCAHDLCKNLFQKLHSLGFADLIEKTKILIDYSQYCERQGQDQSSSQPLRQLESELSDEIAKLDVPNPACNGLVMIVRRVLFCSHYLELVRGRLQELGLAAKERERIHGEPEASPK
jgi:hypothetical protein